MMIVVKADVETGNLCSICRQVCWALHSDSILTATITSCMEMMGQEGRSHITWHVTWHSACLSPASPPRALPVTARHFESLFLDTEYSCDNEYSDWVAFAMMASDSQSSITAAVLLLLLLDCDWWLRAYLFSKNGVGEGMDGCFMDASCLLSFCKFCGFSWSVTYACMDMHFGCLGVYNFVI